MPPRCAAGLAYGRSMADLDFAGRSRRRCINGGRGERRQRELLYAFFTQTYGQRSSFRPLIIPSKSDAQFVIARNAATASVRVVSCAVASLVEELVSAG